MATGTYADFVIFQEQFFGGMVEVVQQQVEVFNEASNGAIRLVTRRLLGHFEQESFYKHTASLIARRDISSVADVTPTKLTQDQFIGTKVNRRIGPVAQTLDAFKKVGQDPGTFSFLLGQQWGPQVMVDYVNTAIAILSKSLAGVSSWDVDKTGASPDTMTHGHLAANLAMMGDRANRIVAWVMHSKPFFDLMQQSITDKITNIADVTIQAGTVASLGRPVIVTDSPELVVAGTPPIYITLGLTADAAEITESEERNIVSEIITGKENLIMQIQGEYAFNAKVNGFKWNTSVANPTDAALRTTANWTKVVADNKSLPGVRLLTN